MVKEADTIHQETQDQIITAPVPKADPAQDHSYIEQCEMFGDAIVLAAKKTVEHFTGRYGTRMKFIQLRQLNGVDKKIRVVGRNTFFTNAFSLDISFRRGHSMPAIQHYGRPTSGSSIRPTSKNHGHVLVNFDTDKFSMDTIVRYAQSQNTIAQLIADMVSTHDRFFTQNPDDTDRIREIAEKHIAAAIEEVFTPKTKPQKSIGLQARERTQRISAAIFENSAPAKKTAPLPAPSTGKNEFEKFGDAVAQTMERTLDDLIRSDRKRPQISVSYSLKGTSNTISFRCKARRFYMPFRMKDFEFSVTFDTSYDAKFFNSPTSTYHEGDANWGRLRIPMNTSNIQISSLIKQKELDALIEQICVGIQFRERILDIYNTEQAKRLPEIVEGHLKHALAAAFGTEYRLQAKPLELTAIDKDAANAQFKTEIKALKDAKDNDLYLLTAFGMAARHQAGADASTVAEWQTGRMLALPDSFDKIRRVNQTLERLVSMGGKERAAHAREILAQIRSLQTTMRSDNKALTADAKSIHSAKTVMAAHSDILTRYVQGFENMRGTLSDKFGEAATDETAEDLLTALAAAQAYSGNQSLTHEKLTHRMMRNLSRLSTQMSFVSQSMSQLVNQMVEAGIGAEAADGALERKIEEKISAIRKVFEPCVIEIEQIDAQLTLIENLEPVDLIEAEKANIRLLAAPHNEELD